MKSVFSILLFVLFLTKIVFCQDVPDYSLMRQYGETSGVYTSVNENDSTISTWKDGVLHGPYCTYYKNGRIKAKGQYQYNLKTGKWLVYSEDGKSKLHILFNKYGSTDVKRVKAPGKSNVIFGRGKVFFDYVLSNNFSSDVVADELIKGEIQFSRGKKHGKQTEYYSNGDLYSVSEFNHGVYDGNRTVYYRGSRLKLNANYKSGLPVGTRDEYAPEGNLIRRIDYKNLPAFEKFYIDKFDISQSFRLQILLDSSFSLVKDLFFPDSLMSLPTMLNNALVLDKITAFEDEFLQKSFIPTHNRNDLSGQVRESAVTPEFTGMILKNELAFNQQNWLMYMYPLALQTVNKNDDKANLGLWVYLPEVGKNIDDSNNYLPKLKTFSYPYIVLPSENNVDDFIKSRILLVEQEHNFWRDIYGLVNKH